MRIPKTGLSTLKTLSVDLRQRVAESRQRSREIAVRRHDAKVCASAPRSPWYANWTDDEGESYGAVLQAIMPQVPAQHRPVMAEALADLGQYNCLQPYQANQKGVAKRRRQWNRIAGRLKEKPNILWVLVGACGGLVVGLMVGLQIPTEDFPIPEGTPLWLIMGGLLATAGGVGGHFIGASGAFHQGMMLVVVNERRSVIRPEIVTGQVEVWIPKVLLAWRAHDWRYRNGKPYLWLMLPIGKRIKDELRSTLDYLRLPNDDYRAQDAAIYAQRSWNRMISDSALDFADIDAGDDGTNNSLKEFAPYLLAAGIVLGGIILVIMNS